MVSDRASAKPGTRNFRPPQPSGVWPYPHTSGSRTTPRPSLPHVLDRLSTQNKPTSSWRACPPSSRIGGRLDAETPSGRSVEVFVSTQRLGAPCSGPSVAFQPASLRFAAIVLLADAEEPYVYLVPST